MVEEEEQQQQQEQKPQQTSSSSGIDPKLGALLSYLIGFIGPIIFLVIEKENKYVRFHAAQALIFQVVYVVLLVGLMVVAGIITAIPGIGFLGAIIFLVSPLIGLAAFALSIVLMIKAWTDYDKGEKFKLPIIGDQAEKIAG